MIKYVTFLFMTASQALAADPGIGSYAKYIYKSQEGNGTPPSIGVQIDSIVGLNPSGPNYQLKTEVLVLGRVNTTSLWNLSGNYFRNTEYFIDHCTQSNGNIENLKVAAGKFSTCHILFNQPDQATISQEVWLNNEVPMFKVKQIRISNDANKTRVSLELQDFKFALGPVQK